MIEFVHGNFKRFIVTIFYMYKKVHMRILSGDMRNTKKIPIKFLEVRKLL